MVGGGALSTDLPRLPSLSHRFSGWYVMLGIAPSVWQLSHALSLLLFFSLLLLLLLFIGGKNTPPTDLLTSARAPSCLYTCHAAGAWRNDGRPHVLFEEQHERTRYKSHFNLLFFLEGRRLLTPQTQRKEKKIDPATRCPPPSLTLFRFFFSEPWWPPCLLDFSVLLSSSPSWQC